MKMTQQTFNDTTNIIHCSGWISRTRLSEKTLWLVVTSNLVVNTKPFFPVWTFTLHPLLTVIKQNRKLNIISVKEQMVSMKKLMTKNKVSDSDCQVYVICNLC